MDKIEELTLRDIFLADVKICKFVTPDNKYIVTKARAVFPNGESLLYVDSYSELQTYALTVDHTELGIKLAQLMKKYHENIGYIVSGEFVGINGDTYELAMHKKEIHNEWKEAFGDEANFVKLQIEVLKVQRQRFS